MMGKSTNSLAIDRAAASAPLSVGVKSMKRMLIAVSAVVVFSQTAAGKPIPHKEQNIRIRHALWGTEPGKDKTGAVRDTCEGLPSCVFRVDDGFLGAPPVGEGLHPFRVDYACGHLAKHKEASDNERVTLTCE